MRSISSKVLSAVFLIIIGILLHFTDVFAEGSEFVDHIFVNVPISCTMRGTGTNSHNAEILNGTYNSAIGDTTVNITCNDNGGFAVYAIGYTDDTDGNTVLASTNVGSTYDIITGTAIGPVGNVDTSNWAMKLSVVTSPTPDYPVTILNSFDSFHVVPNDYTLVAKRTSATDMGNSAVGSTFNTTYQAYISKEQPADTYSGKVKYTLVHPNTIPKPNSTMLDTGKVVGAKMKTLAAGGTTTAYNTKTSDIKAIRMADSLPSGFTPSEANTVSTSTSKHPIYIFFDNTNDAGIMYFYTGGYQVVMNPDSSHMFRSNLALADISGLETWDASNVTSMYALFTDSVILLSNLDDLSSWDVSSVEDLTATFAINGTTYDAGYTSILSDISGLLNWDTGNVTNMFMMFQNIAQLTSLHGLEFWNVSKVENMRLTFAGGSGCTMALSDISALANWDTGNVTNMRAMFQNSVALKDLSPLANWDVSNVTNMKQMFDTASSLKDLSPLANWDVSNVNDMAEMFELTSSLTDKSSLANWDVTSVTATAGSSSSSTNNFYKMFNGSAVTPEPFTLRPGTWNSEGTYVPSS